MKNKDKKIREIVERLELECNAVECDCGENIKDWDICDLIRDLKKVLKSSATRG